MAMEGLMAGVGSRYVQLPLEPPSTEMSPVAAFRQGGPEPTRIFDELPEATIVSVSRPDAGDISPMPISYTIEFPYKQNQFFISGLSGDMMIQNRVLEALYQRIMQAYNDKKNFRVIIVIPLLPGFQGELDDSGAASVRAIMHCQYRTICRGQNSILHHLYDLLGPKTNVVIEDREFTGSYMGGKPWKAGKFSLTLRLSLWSEHRGLQAGEIDGIMDPVAESSYRDIWMATATTNTAVYQDVFSCIPNDLTHFRFAFRQSIAFWKEKIGHTTIDIGIAPKILESYHNGGIKNTDPLGRLASVKGHLVCFPLEFMC